MDTNQSFFVSDELSNAAGFIAGVINSFVWNKQWTFHSSRGWRESALRFGAVFGICYALQLALLITLKQHFTTIDTYYLQLVCMAFYTIINFLINKFYTFSK